jgi:hypothetical protein
VLTDLLLGGSVLVVADVMVVALCEPLALRLLVLKSTLKAILRQSIALRLQAELKAVALPAQSLALTLEAEGVASTRQSLDVKMERVET